MWLAAGHKPCLLRVSGTDMESFLKSEYTSNMFSSKMLSVILATSFHTDVTKCSFSVKFGLNLFFDVLKIEPSIIIDSWDWIAIGRVSVSLEPEYLGSSPWSLLCRIWLQMTSSVLNGSLCSHDILATFLNSWRKWRQVIPLYIQSMVKKKPITSRPLMCGSLKLVTLLPPHPAPELMLAGIFLSLAIKQAPRRVHVSYDGLYKARN